MQDFIFGTLATDELRMRHVRARRAGVTHAQARFPHDPLPGQPITLELTIGPDHPYDQARVYWEVQGPGFPVKQASLRVTPMELVGVEWDTLVWGYVRRFRVTLPGLPEGMILYYRIAAGSLGQGQEFADHGTQYACYIAVDPPPAWAQDAVIYQIFVDRFNPGFGKEWFNPASLSGIYGGTINGITEKLDYIYTLGANLLWLTPIFPSPTHHGYDATDYFDVEPRLGTKADLKELINGAHARGMRLLLDFVPNHWSWLHPTFQHAIAFPDSPYREWYTFSHWPEQYETFFGVRELPQVNLLNPEARLHMLEAVAYWLEFGVDGYRVDDAIGPVVDFWGDFRRITRTVRPDSWTFGEVVEPPDSQLNFEGGLDGCLDFNLLEAFRNAFAFGGWDARRFASFLTCHEAFYPPTFSRPSFLDNHDMNRFLWAAGNDKRRLRLAALCQFTLAGPPIIYYGTEVGLSQERDVRQGERGLPEESRLPMPWGEAQDVDMLAYYRQLIIMRQEHASLRQGTCRVLYVDDNVLVYARGELLVALNLSEQPRQFELIDNAEQGHWSERLEGRILLDTGSSTHDKTIGGSAGITKIGEQLRGYLPALEGMVVK